MKNYKWKILVPIILVSLSVITKYVMWDFPVSTGKRVGNLVKLSKKGKIFKTWEGTIDEGSGDKLTTEFSVRSSEIANQLYEFEARHVVIYYEEYLVNWPWDTKYNVTSWKVQDEDKSIQYNSKNNAVINFIGKTLFCSFLGTLYKNQDLYQQVKDYIKENNMYLYNQYEKCNE